MKLQIHENGQEHYTGATLDTPFNPDQFHLVPDCCDDKVQWALHTDIGSLTVLDRLTGFGWRDTETGFRDPDGEFWLACGSKDVRHSNVKTLGQAIAWVKVNSDKSL